MLTDAKEYGHGRLSEAALQHEGRDDAEGDGRGNLHAGHHGVAGDETQATTPAEPPAFFAVWPVACNAPNMVYKRQLVILMKFYTEKIRRDAS